MGEDGIQHGFLPSGEPYAPSMDPLHILYQDAHLLLVDKPSGLLSVAGKTDGLADCLEYRVKRAFRHALLIHRLDMDTSGIMIFALSRVAQKHLNLQFEKRQVSKSYTARIWGHPKDDQGIVDLPLASDWPNRPLQKVCHENGRSAKTDWKVLAREVDATRVSLHPTTGRTHQLRVHMLAMGHPILGDRFYAGAKALAAADRLQLHAETLGFMHPESAQQVHFSSVCPF